MTNENGAETATVEPRDDGAEHALDADHHSSFDLIRMLFAIFSLILLVAMLIAKSFHAELVTEFTILLFGVFGLGSAPLQLVAPIRGTRFFVTATGLGLAIVLLTGFALIEAHAWWMGVPLFIALASISVVMHLRGLYREGIHVTRGMLRKRLLSSQLRSRGSGLIILTTFIGLGICIGTAIADMHLIPKIGGVPTSITPTWFVGLAFLILSFLIAWKTKPKLIGWPAMSLTLILTITPSIIYDLARYDWTQAHVGLTLYFLQRTRRVRSDRDASDVPDADQNGSTRGKGFYSQPVQLDLRRERRRLRSLPDALLSI
jgi:hypothetical protein